MSTVEQLAPARPATFWGDAACRDLPAEWFHPDRGESLGDARAVCATCAVRIDCLRWAVTNNEHFGVWGGTAERERRRIRRRLIRGEPVPELDQVVPSEMEEVMELAIATPEPAATKTNGGRPIDPDTGQPTDVCVNCGKRYTPDRRTQRFCRKECARAWYAAHPRSEGGVGAITRKPRAAKEPATTALGPAPVPVPPATPLPVPGTVDIQALLGQLLASCDHWHIEADLGDVHVTVSRGAAA